MTIYTDTSPQPTGPTLSIIHISQFPTLEPSSRNHFSSGVQIIAGGVQHFNKCCSAISKGGKIRCELYDCGHFYLTYEKKGGGEKRTSFH